MGAPGCRDALPGHYPFVTLPPIGLYTDSGPDVLYMPSFKGFLSFLIILWLYMYRMFKYCTVPVPSTLALVLLCTTSISHTSTKEMPPVPPPS
jgi:hypothetical protein